MLIIYRLELIPHETHSNQREGIHRVRTHPVLLLLNPVTLELQNYRHFPFPIARLNSEHFGIIRFLSYVADKQTNRQTNHDGPEHPTHADRQSRRG